MNNPDRRQLAADQARLVAALTTGGPLPEGFDAARLQLSSRSLIHKRMRAVARLWPDLARAIGEEFPATFVEYARQHAVPAGGIRGDAMGYARALAERKLLPLRWRWRMLIFRWTMPFKTRR